MNAFAQALTPRRARLSVSMGRVALGTVAMTHALMSGGLSASAGPAIVSVGEAIAGLLIVLGVGPGAYNLPWALKRLRPRRISYPVTQLPSDIFGLKYVPTIEPLHSDDADFIEGKRVDAEVTTRDLAKLEEIMRPRRDRCRLIVEIGVCRNGEGSFSHVFLGRKPDTTAYLGIDLDDKSFLDDAARNIHTLRTDSANQALIRRRIAELGGIIDVLFIDGWHSVRMAINGWRYADLLADDGVVILHDTNCHPGPVSLFDAVDERLFRKEKYFENKADWGVAMRERIP